MFRKSSTLLRLLEGHLCDIDLDIHNDKSESDECATT